MDFGIMYKSNVIIQLEGYTDADWADFKADRQSTLGFVFSLGSGAISWSSKKQVTVALSSTEAKYRGAQSPCVRPVRGHLVEAHIEGSGRSHQGSDSPILRQHEQYLPGSEPRVPPVD